MEETFCPTCGSATAKNDTNDHECSAQQRQDDAAKEQRAREAIPAKGIEGKEEGLGQDAGEQTALSPEAPTPRHAPNDERRKSCG
jgi:hypothetical protein